MPIPLSCNCGRALNVKDELAGKKIRCPECKSILTVPAPEIDPQDLALEVLRAEEPEEESAGRNARRAAIQAEPAEARPPHPQPLSPTGRGESIAYPSPRRGEGRGVRGDDSDDEPPPRARPKRRREKERYTPPVVFERGWFGSVNAGVAGGILMILIAVVWFIGGLAAGYIFFYPPILLVIGIIAIVKGGLGNN